MLQRYWVYLRVTIKEIIDNQLPIDGWYTLFDFKEAYTLILSIKSISKITKMINYFTNTFDLLSGDSSMLSVDIQILVLESSIVSLLYIKVVYMILGLLCEYSN
jgi:hypothetical protein